MSKKQFPFHFLLLFKRDFKCMKNATNSKIVLRVASIEFMLSFNKGEVMLSLTIKVENICQVKYSSRKNRMS